nr:leucine rich repeats containing F box [Hymenolepis microstoma]
MQSPDSSTLSSTVFSICPKCKYQNSKCLNWCTVCGSLLIGSESIPTDSSSSFYLPQNYQTYDSSADSPLQNDENQSSFVNSNPFSPPLLNRKYASDISMHSMSSLLDVRSYPSQSRASPIRSNLFANNHFPYVQSNPVLGLNFQRPSRQRCISGPCDGTYRIDQYLRNLYWNNFSFSSPFFSEAEINEPNHLDYINFVNIDPMVMQTGQFNQTNLVFFQNDHQSKPGVGQIPELLNDCRTDTLRQQNMGELNSKQSQNPRHAYGFRGNGPISRCNNRVRWNGRKQKAPKHPQQVNTVVKESIQSCTSLIDFSADVKPFQPSEISPEGATEESGPSWQNMPSEWWYGVVRHLSYSDRSALALTCRRLSMIVANRVNWRTIRLERYQHLSDTALMQIGRKKPKHLHFEYCSGEGVTEGGVDRLFRACGKGLESVSFVGCYKGAFQGDYPLMVSARRCPNLHYIDASYVQSVRDQTVRAISRGSKALKSLLLNGAQLISNSAIEHVVRRHKTTLERLELFGCFHLNSRIFTTLGECRGLRALAFGFLHHLSANGLLELFPKLPRLSSLDLRGTQKLVTDATLSLLATECPLLEEIVLANLTSLTGEEGVIKMLHQLPRLRVLDLCGLVVVGDGTVRALATSCPLLEELDISATSVTEVGLKYLSEAPTTSLKSLRINHKPDITAEAIETLIKSCPKLTRLTLYGFDFIKSWEFLFNHRPMLVISTERERFTRSSSK